MNSVLNAMSVRFSISILLIIVTVSKLCDGQQCDAVKRILIKLRSIFIETANVEIQNQRNVCAFTGSHVQLIDSPHLSTWILDTPQKDWAFEGPLAIQNGNLIVRIQNGLVKGRPALTTGQGKPYIAFTGIKYAEPPIGDLRFSPPVPKANWEGIYDATVDGPSCVQSSGPVEGVEDCLNLNVYTPKLPSSETSELLPTMVFIHGGGYEAGNANSTSLSPGLFIEKDVLIVTFTYRLGCLGFLTTGDLVVPGNAGGKDQVLALQWVQTNIAAFGGDPGNVTLFGQSAGAASVAYLLVSPLSAGLFRNVLIQSGTNLSPWAYDRNGPENFRSLATSKGIIFKNTEDTVADLRAVDYQELQTLCAQLKSLNLLVKNPLQGFTFVPTKEVPHAGAFFSGKSHEEFKLGNFKRVRILLGHNSLEGAFLFTLPIRLLFAKFDLDKVGLVPAGLNIRGLIIPPIVGNRIKNKYYGIIPPISTSNVSAMVHIGDDQFNRGTRELIRQVCKYVQNVYFYIFSYQGGLSGNPPGAFPGATHFEEMGYMWENSSRVASPQDELVRQRLITLWTNFAKTGDPTPTNDSLLQYQKWLSACENFRYLSIGANLELSANPSPDKMGMWDDIEQTFGNPPYDTY